MAHFIIPNVSKEIEEQIEREKHIIQKAVWEVDPAFLNEVRAESALDGEISNRQNEEFSENQSGATPRARCRRRRRWRSKNTTNPTLKSGIVSRDSYFNDNDDVTYPGSQNPFHKDNEYQNNDEKTEHDDKHTISYF